MEKINKTSFLQKISKFYKRLCKKYNYFSSIITIILTMALTMGIVITTKNIMTTDEVVSIAINSAEEAFYNKKYDVAIEEYQKLQEKSQWPLQNLKIAEIYSIKCDYVKSNELLSKVYEARNKAITNIDKKELQECSDDELTNELVVTYFMNGESKKALEYGEVFLKENSNNKELLNTIFNIYIMNNQPDKAKEIVNNYPNEDLTVDELTILARMNMLTGNWENGLKLLEDAWNKDNSEIMILDVIEQVYSYDKDEFVKKLSELEKKNSDKEFFKVCLAKVYSMSKESAQKSIEMIKKISDKIEDKRMIKLIEYKAYKNIGQEEPQKVLQEILNDNSESFIDLYIASLYSYENGDCKAALNYANKSILVNKNYSNVYGILIPDIMIKEAKGEELKLEVIEPFFRISLNKELFNPSVVLNIAQYYSDVIKDSNKALQYYDIAAKMNPKNAEIYYNSALIKINNQRENEAIELLNKSIKLDDKTSKYYRTLGTLYLNKGKNEEAIKAIRKSYDIDKNDILTLNNAGYYYITVEKDADRALANFKGAYEGINEKIDNKTKEIITDNYNRIKNYKKGDKNGSIISQFKLVQ
ncbi:tetratricopeptide repeat protein [Clostridium weizhouense]|uniref:Tetratricopeptide repeat protein n=1 Tax=Clostridium weizhouense TaxID=2859781 RepID=A0ABS7AS40_9CLOT|nr:tetratricopeptide repeat protein [Clostridium weizhouense]MBW6411221.1 hypothetical protein [Clostridium weizhouense]